MGMVVFSANAQEVSNDEFSRCRQAPIIFPRG